jgi:multiple sugar transport system permease protein
LLRRRTRNQATMVYFVVLVVVSVAWFLVRRRSNSAEA